MGLFWDILQQGQIDEQAEKSEDLEERVAALEEELKKTQNLLRKTLLALEKYTQQDIDGDGNIG